MRSASKPAFTLHIEAPSNGKVGAATIDVLDEGGKTADSDSVNLKKESERRKWSKRVAEKLGLDQAGLNGQLEVEWNKALDERRRVRKQADAGSPEAAEQTSIQVLAEPACAIRRPLCLVGGRSYATAWIQVQVTTRQTVDGNGKVTRHDPPLVDLADRRVVVSGDGSAFCDGVLPGAAPLADLGVPLDLAHPLTPGRGWSGAGFTRYLAGERPDPADVFSRVVRVIDAFVDFDRGLAPQQTMCELTACWDLASWLLDAFHVTGYLWPTAEAGSGKTTFLTAVAELGYLGEVILSGSSYACLRDLADYGAVLAFDDAENVMDVRKTDPDKRTLLLAGNRRGVTVAVKEKTAGDRWTTRHVHTFCPRLFSAIRLPDATLGSRSIVVRLVRSGDPVRTRANILDYASWPCNRRRLIDDLWALGLENLPALPEHDAAMTKLARLSGRDLEPWRSILAVAHWLQERHHQDGLFDRLEDLSMEYQEDRQDFERFNLSRALVWGLRELMGEHEEIEFTPAELATRINGIATAEDMVDEGEEATNARRVGWTLKRLGFKRAGRDKCNKSWKASRQAVESLCRAFRVPDPAESEKAEGEPIDTPF
jgi:hypothetical protein